MAPKKSPKTKASKSKKAAAKKKAAPKKKAPALKSASRSTATNNNWKVVCSVDGTIARNLSRAAAEAQSNDHEARTGHRTTFTNTQ